MGDSKYGIKPSFILTVDESFTLLRDQYHITRHLFDFLFGPYFLNFEVDEGRTVRTLERRSTTRSETRESPLLQRPVVAGERYPSSSRLSAGTIAHPPSFGVSLSKLSERSFCSGKKRGVQYFGERNRIHLFGFYLERYASSVTDDGYANIEHSKFF